MLRRVCPVSYEAFVPKYGGTRFLEGDDQSVFSLFAGLRRILVNCGVVTVDELKIAVEEFACYAVETRR